MSIFTIPIFIYFWNYSANITKSLSKSFGQSNQISIGQYEDIDWCILCSEMYFSQEAAAGFGKILKVEKCVKLAINGFWCF